MGRLPRLVATLTRWGLSLCALVLVLAALYVSLGRQLTPLVAEYRVDVETRASSALGMPLSIGSLEGSWSRFAPVFLAHDVMVGEGSSAVRLDRVRVVPDLWESLLARQVRIAHLEVDGLQFMLRQDKEGNWSVQGLPVRNDSPFDPGQVLEQMQMVSHLSLLDSQVTVQPFDAAPLTLTYVNLSLATGSYHQRLDARLTLPDGQPFALNVRSRIQASQWKDGEADVYASLPQSDWAKWLPKSLTREWTLSKLQAGGELWMSWGKGTVQSATARLNAPHVKGVYAGRKPSTVDNLALNADRKSVV